MERAGGVQDETATVPLGAPGSDENAETATLLLRRCTALAARARVDLLSPGRGGAAEELADVLARMRSWEPATLEPPDPTMTVLAAAALQDLAERLSLDAAQQELSPSTLSAEVEAALSVLQALMAGGRVDVPA